MANSTSEQHEYIVPQRSNRRSDWKYWCIATLSLLTFILLFHTWLVASGPYGDLYTNAFGWIKGSIPELDTVDTIGYKADSYPSLTDAWGMLAGTAAVITIFAAILYLLLRIEALSRLMTLASVATAVFVLATLQYLNGKAPELRDMTEHRDESAGVGNILHTVLGGGKGSNPEAAQQVATAGLKAPALVCGLAAVAVAILAITELWNRIRITVTDKPYSVSSYSLEPSSRKHVFSEPELGGEHIPERSTNPPVGVSVDVLGPPNRTMGDRMDTSAWTAANPLQINITVTGDHHRENAASSGVSVGV